MTTPQIRNRTKTVTRRLAWGELKVGARIQAIVKAMGLKKGEKVERLAVIEVVRVHREPLNRITHSDCVAEGFPDYSPEQFIRMFTEHMGCQRWTTVTRIEFKYVDEN